MAGADYLLTGPDAAYLAAGPFTPESGGADQATIDASIAAHAAAADPHPTYDTAAEVSTAIGVHAAAVDPHPIYLTQAEADALYAGGGAAPTVTSVVQTVNNWNGDGNAAFGSAPSQNNRLVANISIQPGAAGVILQSGWNWHLLGSFAGNNGTYCQLWWGDPDPSVASAAALFYTGGGTRHIQIAEIATNLKGQIVQMSYLPTSGSATVSTFKTPAMVPAEAAWCFALCRCATGGAAIVDAPPTGMSSLVGPVLGGFQHGVASNTSQGIWTTVDGNRDFCGATFFLK